MQLSAESRVNLLAVESASFGIDFGMEAFMEWHNSECLKQTILAPEQRVAFHSLDACIAYSMRYRHSLNVSVF